MKAFLTALVTLVLTLPAAAQPWYARGTFGNPDTPGPGGNSPWNDLSYQLADQGGGVYTGTVATGAFPNIPFEYKVANADFTTTAPGGNGKLVTNANGELNFHFYDNTTWADGWSPNNQRRVGYNDPEQFGWEVVGSFNDWPAATDPNFHLTNQSNGLYHGQFALDKGFYEFKFRQQGDWSINYGTDFTNGGSNNSIRVWTTGDVWNFDLDLPNGRLRAYTTAPTPDRNNDNIVDASDYVLWRKQDGSAAGYNVWRENFGFGTGPTQWYARGSFNGYGLANPMVDQGNGTFTAAVTGLTAGTDYEYKIANDDFSQAFPGSNGKVRANANGEINFNFFQLPTATTWSDGWSPNNVSRVGYQDSNQYDWEIVGGFNNWPAPNDPAFALIDQGNGLHTGSFTFATAGAFEFKFRHITADQMADPAWNTSIGDNFGNSAGNNSFTVANAGDTWNFELDLPNGRWRVYQPVMVGAGAAVPEPASLVLLMFGLAFAGAARRRK